MKILIYTGYHNTEFSVAHWREHGGNGVINQTIDMAQAFSGAGHDVTLSGHMLSESDPDMKILPTHELAQGAHYDVVIGVNYIHYINELEEHGITWDQSLFLVHFNNHYPWWRGDALPDLGAQLFHDPRMTWVVTLSEKHKKAYLKNNPSASKKARVIGNGLNPADWSSEKPEKVKNRFIYTSRHRDGLDTLVSIWPAVLEEAPDATLVIAQPESMEEHAPLPEIPSVRFMGQVSSDQLREEISVAEYWLNPTSHVEEYGLTALEMMMGGVKVISKPSGNLSELIIDRGWVIDDREISIDGACLNAWRTCRDSAEEADKRLDAAHKFAKEQSWEKRCNEWLALINEKPKPSCLYPELYTYFEDPEAWEKQFVSYAARTMEWELVVDEPFDNCFSFPLFTEEFCTKIREEAEHSECWTTDRHDFYPTTDMLLDVLGLREIYTAVVAKYVISCAKKLWVLPNDWDDHNAETFLAKYTASAQGHLSMHHDHSDLTCLIQLSRMDEYKGGGTYFQRQKKLVKNEMGWATLHPGNITHRHGGRAISEGLRYILVSFITRNRAA